MGSMPKRHACWSGSAAKVLPVLAASASSACVAVDITTAMHNAAVQRPEAMKALSAVYASMQRQASPGRSGAG